MSSVFPISIIAIGGLLTIGGTLWLALINMRSGAETRQANAKLLDTAQDAAARLGNDKTRDELIQARTRLLAGNHPISENPVKAIITQLPVRAEEYNKLNQDKAHMVEDMATDFELCWAPLIHFTLEEFDRALEQIKRELGPNGQSIQGKFA